MADDPIVPPDPSVVPPDHFPVVPPDRFPVVPPDIPPLTLRAFPARLVPTAAHHQVQEVDAGVGEDPVLQLREAHRMHDPELLAQGVHSLRARVDPRGIGPLRALLTVTGQRGGSMKNR